MQPAGSGEGQAAADTIRLSQHSPLQCGRGHCHAPCSRLSLQAFTCYVYFYAYPLCTVKVARKPLGEKSSSSSLFAQVNEQCSWGSGLPSFLPISSEPIRGSLKGMEVEKGPVWPRAAVLLLRAAAQAVLWDSALHPQNLAAPFCWGCPVVCMTFSRFTCCTTQFITMHFDIFLSTNS